MKLRKLMLTVLVAGAIALTSSCGSLPLSALGALGGSSSNDGVQVGTEDITIGKKEESNELQVGDNSTQEAERIVNTSVQDIPPYVVLLIVLLAGWAIPDPQTMGRGLLAFINALVPWGKKD